MESVLGKRLQGLETVIVTGGSSGIGKSFIDRIQNLEREIAICNISRRKPEVFFSPCPLHHLPCDLGKRDQLESAAAGALAVIRERPGKVLLINNSGFGAYGPFPEPGLEHTLDMIELNVKAVIHLTALLLPAIKERGGAIMNVASTAAFQATPYLGTYGATKAFLLHWSLSLREELRPAGIDVMALCPGPTSTAFFSRAGFDQPVVSDHFGQTAEEVVTAAFAGLRRRKGVVVSGNLNKCLVIASSLLPKSMAARVSEKVLRRIRMNKQA